MWNERLSVGYPSWGDGTKRDCEFLEDCTCREWVDIWVEEDCLMLRYLVVSVYTSSCLDIPRDGPLVWRVLKGQYSRYRFFNVMASLVIWGSMSYTAITSMRQDAYSGARVSTTNISDSSYRLTNRFNRNHLSSPFNSRSLPGNP